MDTLQLKGLAFHGYHGTEPWEQEVGRRFVVDVTLHGDWTKAGRSDDLNDAIDYRTIYATARKVLVDEKHALIERIAWRLLEELFAGFPVERVTVRVAKPEAPLGGLNEAAVVELTRDRNELPGRQPLGFQV